MKVRCNPKAIYIDKNFSYREGKLIKKWINDWYLNGSKWDLTELGMAFAFVLRRSQKILIREMPSYFCVDLIKC